MESEKIRLDESILKWQKIFFKLLFSIFKIACLFPATQFFSEFFINMIFECQNVPISTKLPNLQILFQTKMWATIIK